VTAVVERYNALLAAGELKPDADQQRAVEALDRLAVQLANSGRGFFRRSKPPGGAYLWGGVGRGK